MDNESTSKLRLDRRMARRRGWIDKTELARELDSLPDISSKVAGGDDPETPAAPEPAAAPSPGLPEAEGA